MIKVVKPIVEIEGDEMAQVMWRRIKALLIEPYLDMPIETYDLSAHNRDATSDAVTVDAAHAILRTGVGIKCATIAPDAARISELSLRRQLKGCNGVIRSILGGVMFREPVVCPGVPTIVPGWTKPIVVARHVFGDVQSATEIAAPGPGKLILRFEGKSANGEPASFERLVYDYPGPGVALAIYNTDESFRDFARGCLNYALAHRLPVVFTTKNTVLKLYDERFKKIFQQVFDEEFNDEFLRAGIAYEHRLIDDMVAAALRSEGGFLWACKNHDGDVQSDFVAQGFGSLGLMTSALVARGGTVVMTEAAHGTITRHYREHLLGRPTSTNPIASIVAWSRGLAHRAGLDAHTELARFAAQLEQACLEIVASGRMTRDLARLVGPNKEWLTTDQFLDAAAERLRLIRGGGREAPPKKQAARARTAGDIEGSMAMDGSMSCSVVICAHSMERWLDIREAVDSVKAQLAPAEEIVLVIDHNRNLYERSLKEFPDVTVIENREQKGLSGARNSGVAASNGEIVAFLDDDAVADKGWLKATAKAFENPSICGVGAVASPLWLGSRPPWFPDEFLWVVGCAYRGLQTGAVRNGLGCAMALRRAIFQRIGGFDPRLGRNGSLLPISCEETEFSLRAARAFPNASFVHAPDAAVDHKVPAARLTLNYFTLRCFAEGVSKARMARLSGSGSLATERGYVLRTLSRGVAKGVKDAVFKGDVWAGARALVIMVGLASTVAGYAWDTLGSALDGGGAARRRSPAAQIPEGRGLE
jgi:isocitrate dehydrogenase